MFSRWFGSQKVDCCVEPNSQGPFYEDFEVGQRIEHENGRTITETDNIWFTLLTCNTNQIHYNQEYTKKHYSEPPFNGRLVVNSFLVLSIVIGLSVTDTSKNGVMLGMTDCKVLNPTFCGDTISAATEIVDKRMSESHQNMGIITVLTKGYNQEKEPVIEFTRTFMVRKIGKDWDANHRQKIRNIINPNDVRLSTLETSSHD
jgi:itaconyl-CoA hydratase